jgi:hypothetical protein
VTISDVSGACPSMAAAVAEPENVAANASSEMPASFIVALILFFIFIPVWLTRTLFVFPNLTQKLCQGINMRKYNEL